LQQNCLGATETQGPTNNRVFCVHRMIGLCEL